VDRDTAWTLADKVRLDFPTFHTEGLAVTPDHLFLSAVEILEPTQKYPTPVDGYDRTPGKGIGHLFVMDRSGHLQKDIVLGGGDRYHPGGIDFDGRNVWVPVAEYRPDSSAIIYRVNATTLRVSRAFDVEDHIGGLALIDLRTHRTLREVPLQLWSTAQHVITRNPVKLAAQNSTLDLWAAPDNGDEGNGTELLHYRTTVVPTDR
jgi:hypothetical protein